MDISDWVDYIEATYALKDDDITSLKKDDQLDIVFIDRNFVDLIHENNKTHYNPTDIINKIYRGVFTYSGEGLKGSFFFKNLNQTKPFEFEIYIPQLKMWYPSNYHMQIKTYTSPLYVGWRGFCLLQKDFLSLPTVIYNN